MTDIDRILAEELPPDSASGPRYSPVGNVAPEVLNGSRLAQARTATQFTSESQPMDRAPMSAALRRRGTREKFDAIADDAYERAANGSVRDKEFITYQLEGKPGVRIADGEWSPEQAPTYQIMMAYHQQLVGQPQTPALQSGSLEASDQTTEEG